MIHFAGTMYYNTIARSTLLIAIVVAVIPYNAFPDDQLTNRLPELLISAESIIRGRDQKPEMQLIDIRPAAEFDRISIPGSMNIPLYAIKTKTFLKKNPLIIIDKGYHYSRIEEECKLLRKSGFKVWIMDGGLYAWSQNGGNIEGDGFARKALNRIPPIHFFPEKNYQDWVIFNIAANKKEYSDIFPRAISLPFTTDDEAFASHYKKVFEEQKMNPFARVIIVDKRGDSYDRLEKIIRNTAYKDVFFLEGGREAYGKYVTGLNNAVKKSALTLRKNSCPGSCQ